jgi:hypothetical protein
MNKSIINKQLALRCTLFVSIILFEYFSNHWIHKNICRYMLTDIKPNISKNIIGDISFHTLDYEVQTYHAVVNNKGANERVKLKELIEINSWKKIGDTPNLLFEDSLHFYEFIETEDPYLTCKTKLLP